VNQNVLPTGLSAHQFRQSPRNRQAQSRAAELARRGIVDLLEGLEQLRNGLLGDADAGILDLEADQHVFLALFLHACTQGDGSALTELDRIARVVQQRLRQPRRVADELRRHRVTLEHKLKTFFPGRVGDHRTDVIDERTDIEFGQIEDELVCFYAG
jgi:hypothetical protein